MLENFDQKLSQEIAFTFVTHYTIITVKNIVISFSPKFQQQYNDLLNMIIIIIVLTLYMILFLKNINVFKVYKNQLKMLFFIFILWIVSFLLNPNIFSYSYVLNDLKSFIAYSFPILIFIPMVEDRSYILKYLYRASNFMFWIAFIFGLLGLSQSGDNIFTSYSMSYGRNAMFVSVLLYSKFFSSRKTTYLLKATFIFILIVLNGSRFPILVISFYLYIKIIAQYKWYKSVLLTFVFLMMSYLIYRNLTSISTKVFHGLEKINIYSRTLYLFSLGKGTSTSGRDVIHERLYMFLRESPLWGYGAGAGTILLDNGLAHGMIIDVFATLGYFFGGLFLLHVIFSVSEALKITCNWSDKELLLIAISNFFPISTIQLGMWSANTMWLTLALSYSIKNSKKDLRRYNYARG